VRICLAQRHLRPFGSTSHRPFPSSFTKPLDPPSHITPRAPQLHSTEESLREEPGPRRDRAPEGRRRPSDLPFLQTSHNSHESAYYQAYERPVHDHG
jgi:hypothetical protein